MIDRAPLHWLGESLVTVKGRSPASSRLVPTALGRKRNLLIMDAPGRLRGKLRRSALRNAADTLLRIAANVASEPEPSPV